MQAQKLQNRIYSKITREWNRSLLLFECRRLRKIKAITQGHLNFSLLSMVHTKDVLPYLLAVRSFTYFLNPKAIYVLCDPSISEEDRNLIRSQIPHVQFLQAEHFRHKLTPMGGCWERLNAISQLASTSYVIQLDADTVTFSNPTSVIESIESSRSFVLGESRNGRVVSFEEASSNAAQFQGDPPHIQHLSEFVMKDLDVENRNYIRGCAGFCGFHRQENLPELVQQFSAKMQTALSSRWQEWGSEQVCSNYIIANQQRPLILPFPEYATPDEQDGSQTFSHFIGSIRFASSHYSKAANLVIDNLVRNN